MNILYFSSNCIVAFFWTQYIIYYIHGKQEYLNLFNAIAIPIVSVYCLIAISSPFTHLIFYIEPVINQIRMGPLFAMQIIITYGLFTFSSAVALASLLSKKPHPSYYHRYVTFFSFLFFPLAGGVLHVMFPGANVVWQALTLGFLLVYTEFQFDLVSRDSLTSLNNRRAFEQKLAQTEYIEGSKNQPHIFMLDINFFKDINDLYGHPEGDHALVITSELLKRIFGKSDAFISRYGGDEFAIIYSCTLEEAAILRIKIYKLFEEFNQTAEHPYRISVSVGYGAVTGEGLEAAKSALKKADEELYTEKQFMHEALNQL